MDKNINLLEENIKKYFEKSENKNIDSLEEKIRIYLEKTQQVQPPENPAPAPENPAPAPAPAPAPPPVQPVQPENPAPTPAPAPAPPPVQPVQPPPENPVQPVQPTPAPPPVQPVQPVQPAPSPAPVQPVQPVQPTPAEKTVPADEEYLVFNIDEQNIIKMCKNNEEFINNYKHFVQENIVEEIKIGRKIISKIELKQKINNNIIKNVYIIKIKKQIYELYDLDDTLLHSYNSKKNSTKESIDDLLTTNSKPIDNINMFLKIKQDNENYYFAEYINRFSLSWTLPYLNIVKALRYEKYIN